MADIMPEEEAMPTETMLPDEEMEEDYVDFVVSSTLSEDDKNYLESALIEDCLLYTSPSPRDATLSRMPSSA